MTLFVESSHQRHRCATHHTMSRFDPDQRALTSHPAPSWMLGLITRRSHSCRKKQPNTIGRPQNIIPTPPTIMAKRPSIIDGGHHEKAAHHAHTAGGHALHAREHSEEARKAHMAEHG